MAAFGSFVYGSGQVYGSDIEVSNIDLISRRMIKIQVVDEVVVDDNYNNPDNYTISIVSGSGPVRVLRVLPINTKVSRDIILITDPVTAGTRYRIRFQNISDRLGTANIGVGGGDFIARFTKTDSTLKSIPKHFDKRPGSTISNVLSAISIGDDTIGGARKDSLEYVPPILVGSDPTPQVIIVSPINAGTHTGTTPTMSGTYQDADRIVGIWNESVGYDAVLNTIAGTWSVVTPSSVLVFAVSDVISFKAVAIGSGGTTATGVGTATVV